MKTLVTSAAVVFAAWTLIAAPVAAQDSPPDSPEAKTRTVWVDGKGQKGMADKVNKLHTQMNAEGWTFADLEVYEENGDMEGLFVTYVRSRP